MDHFPPVDINIDLKFKKSHESPLSCHASFVINPKHSIFGSQTHVMESSQHSISKGTISERHTGMLWIVSIVWEGKEPTG